MKLKSSVALDQNTRILWLIGGARVFKNRSLSRASKPVPNAASGEKNSRGAVAEAPPFVRCKKNVGTPDLAATVAIPFIDHSTEVWNFQSDGTALKER
jgi:hypothetical protein